MYHGTTLKTLELFRSYNGISIFNVRCTVWAGSWPKLKLWKENLESVRCVTLFSCSNNLAPRKMIHIWIAIGSSVRIVLTLMQVTFRGSSLQDRRLGVGDFGGRVPAHLLTFSSLYEELLFFCALFLGIRFILFLGTATIEPINFHCINFQLYLKKRIWRETKRCILLTWRRKRKCGGFEGTRWLFLFIWQRYENFMITLWQP